MLCFNINFVINKELQKQNKKIDGWGEKISMIEI